MAVDLLQARRQYVQDAAEAYTATGTGDVLVFTPNTPVDIVRWGFIVTTTLDVGAGAAFAGDHRPTAGSDTSRVDGSISSSVDTAGGTLTVTADIAAGQVAYHEMSQNLEVDPGEEFVIECTNAADTAGVIRGFVEYVEKPFVGDSDATAGTAANRLGNVTEYSS